MLPGRVINQQIPLNVSRKCIGNRQQLRQKIYETQWCNLITNVERIHKEAGFAQLFAFVLYCRHFQQFYP